MVTIALQEISDCGGNVSTSEEKSEEAVALGSDREPLIMKAEAAKRVQLETKGTRESNGGASSSLEMKLTAKTATTGVPVFTTTTTTTTSRTTTEATTAKPRPDLKLN